MIELRRVWSKTRLELMYRDDDGILRTRKYSYSVTFRVRFGFNTGKTIGGLVGAKSPHCTRQTDGDSCVGSESVYNMWSCEAGDFGS